MSEDRAGASSDIPWASVFDPAVNVRALGEIQARGFRAATELVDRFVRMTDATAGSAAASSVRHSDAGSEKSTPAAPPGFATMISAWQAAVGRWADTVAPPAAGRPADPASVDLPTASATGCVSIHAETPGPATADVWLHNTGDTDLGEVRLRCTDLMAHDGSLVRSDVIGFDPEAAAMPGRSSRGLRIAVAVTADTRPGTYHGTLLVHGHPGAWLPVTLLVSEASP